MRLTVYGMSLVWLTVPSPLVRLPLALTLPLAIEGAFARAAVFFTAFATGSDKNLLLRILLEALEEGPALPAAGGVVVFAEVVPPLATRLSTPELPSVLKPDIWIDADSAIVENGPVQQSARRKTLRARVILDEAEAAWAFVESMEAHCDLVDLPDLHKVLCDLLL